MDELMLLMLMRGACIGLVARGRSQEAASRRDNLFTLFQLLLLRLAIYMYTGGGIGVVCEGDE